MPDRFCAAPAARQKALVGWARILLAWTDSAQLPPQWLFPFRISGMGSSLLPCQRTEFGAAIGSGRTEGNADPGWLPVMFAAEPDNVTGRDAAGC